MNTGWQKTGKVAVGFIRHRWHFLLMRFVKMFISPILMKDNNSNNNRKNNQNSEPKVISHIYFSRCRLVSFTNHIIQQTDIFVKYFKSPEKPIRGWVCLTPILLII